MSEPDRAFDPLDGVERQLERSSLFTQTALGRLGLRLHEAERLLVGLLDILLAQGVVSAEQLDAAARRVADELVARGEVPDRLVALRVDADAKAPLAPVDCAARMHVCKAICCKLDFALSRDEVEAGKVRWDLGRPYAIRHEADGYCHHSDRATGRCGVYAHRPGICRTYSCEKDGRIWKDFAAMELNTQWLRENLSDGGQPRMLRAVMQRPPVQEEPEPVSPATPSVT